MAPQARTSARKRDALNRPASATVAPTARAGAHNAMMALPWNIGMGQKHTSSGANPYACEARPAISGQPSLGAAHRLGVSRRPRREQQQEQVVGRHGGGFAGTGIAGNGRAPRRVP